MTPGETLTAADPEPPLGTRVRDSFGIEWVREHEQDGGYWVRCVPVPGRDPKPWAKIAGAYGPVAVTALT